MGLTCTQNNKCECSETHTWKGSVCIGLSSYNEGPCLDDSTCKESLICRLDSIPCNCYLPVANSKCDCPRVIGSETYWDGKNEISILINQFEII